MKKRRHRLVRLNRLKGRLLAAYLNEKHRNLSGFRVVRIVQAVYDRKLHEVVKITAATYDGGKHGGYGGRRVQLGREEIMRPGAGIEVAGRIVPLADYINELKEKRHASGKKENAAAPAAAEEDVSGDYEGFFRLQTDPPETET